MAVIGYARVSTTDQDLSIQEAALRAAGCDVIRAEKRSGTTTRGRDELRTVLEFLRPGDMLIVTRIDRLARSIADLQDIVRQVRARGASLKATEQPIDTGTAAGKCFLDMLGVFAEFETNLRKERQLEGIAKAKAAGICRGRPASIDLARVREMKAQGLSGLRPSPRRSASAGRASIGCLRLVNDDWPSLHGETRLRLIALSSPNNCCSNEGGGDDHWEVAMKALSFTSFSS
jgi:DNA invertase Pin-like site-specific DNA recombinase